MTTNLTISNDFDVPASPLAPLIPFSPLAPRSPVAPFVPGVPLRPGIPGLPTPRSPLNDKRALDYSVIFVILYLFHQVDRADQVDPECIEYCLQLTKAYHAEFQLYLVVDPKNYWPIYVAKQLMLVCSHIPRHELT